MKKAKYIAVTVILGALGSAFWEVCLKKFLVLIVSNTIPHILQNFNDSFYARIPNSLDTPDFLSLFYFVLVIIAFITISPNRLIEIFHSREDDKILKITQNVVKIVYCFIIMYNFSLAALASNAAKHTLNNIEIISPYITDMEYKQLRSDFFQIDSKSDYEQLVDKISSVANDNELQIR